MSVYISVEAEKYLFLKTFWPKNTCLASVLTLGRKQVSSAVLVFLCFSPFDF